MSSGSKAVFLSYASQDSEAARKICEALRSGGIEVWFDVEGGLEHGDEWDAKIRRQIKECVLFIPIISANTQARHEGYFRIEWELAAQRAMGIASGVPFILPVMIDDTREPEALVPDRFRAVQWTRLRNGDAPDDVKARLLKLWSHRVGALKGVTAEVAPVSGWRETGDSAISAGQRPALLRRWLVAAMLFAAAIGTWWTFSSRLKSSPSNIAVTAASSGSSEVQMLVAKARQVLDEGDEANRETYALAEDLLKRAVALDPANALAWATYADSSYFLVWHAIDLSDSRKEAMQQQAERARTLAPDLPEAIIVSADIGSYLRQDLPTLERQILALTSREPGRWRAYRTLGYLYRAMGRTDDSIRALQRAYEISNGSPRASADLLNVLTRRDRWLESEPIVVEALKKRPNGRILWYDVVLRVYWRGDIAGAEGALGSWPGWLLSGDRGAFQAWQTWFLGRQPDKALAAIQQVPRDYLSDYTSTGPRAAFTARAHEMAGHAEAARTDWATAIQVCDRVLATSPESGPALYWKAWALARLGNLPAAQAICTQMQQRGLLSPAGASQWGGVNIIPALWATVGRPEVAFAELAKPRVAGDERYAVTRAMLELDPAYDPLRTDPRFRKVLEEAVAPPAAAVTPPSMSLVQAKSVAVLPFANLSTQADNESFADGMHDDVITALSKIHDLTVISRTSVMAYKAGARNLKQIAAELDVANVLEGSVQRAGGKVRLNVQLIDARTDAHLWAENYTEDISDVFAVQSRLAAAITKALQATLSPQEQALIGRRPTQNAEAYDLYQRGRQVWEGLGLGNTRANYERVVTLLEQAVAKDRGFAQAYAQLASLHGELYWFASLDPSAERRAKAEAALREAVRLAPDAPETLMAQGVFEYRINNDWARALDYYRQAEPALPNDAELLNQIGAALRRLGRLPEAAAAFERAVVLNPHDLGLVGTAVQTLEVVRNPRHVLATAERYLALFPDYAILRDYRIAAQFELDGDRASYLQQLSELPKRSTDPDGRHQAYVNALRRGDLAAAAEELEDPRFGRINLAGYRDVASVMGTTATGFAEPREMQQAYVAYLRGRPTDAARFADQAIALIRAEPRLPRQEHAAEMAVALADAYAGRFDAALSRARQAVAAQLKVDPYAALLMQTSPGRILVMAGRGDEALAELREGIGRPQMPIPDNIRHDPIWSRLKDDPRFEEILRAAEAAIRSRP